jgi:excisionase family DNA binding protein
MMATEMGQAELHQPPRLVSVEEAARMLGIGRTLAWGLVYRRQLKTIRLGKRVLVPQAEVDRIAAGEEI